MELMLLAAGSNLVFYVWTLVLLAIWVLIAFDVRGFYRRRFRSR
jgi:hypothetical protein